MESAQTLCGDLTAFLHMRTPSMFMNEFLL